MNNMKQKINDAFSARIKFGDLKVGAKFKIFPGEDWRILRKIVSIVIDKRQSNCIVINDTHDGRLLHDFFENDIDIIEIPGR